MIRMDGAAIGKFFLSDLPCSVNIQIVKSNLFKTLENGARF